MFLFLSLSLSLPPSLSNSAVIPDMLEKILPADGTKTVGELFYEVLEGIGKLQNFAVYMEGSRVPLDFSVDTSVLVGQKVLIKYLPGPCKFSSKVIVVDILLRGFVL